MADTKITDLTADASPTTDDLIVTVNDPAGTPANRKVTIANLFSLWGTTALTASSKTFASPVITGDIVLTERADHAATPASGFGYLWVKNTTPSKIIFTDDTGTDITLSSGSMSNLSDDTTPQLGGSLDVNGNKIVSVSNGDIDIEPNGTGNVLLGNFTLNADATVGAGQDNFALIYDHGSGTWGPEAITEALISDLGTYQVELSEGQFANGDKTKLDGIESGATADQSAAEIAAMSQDWRGTGAETLIQATTALQGAGGLSNVVEDTTPQLGGNLDLSDGTTDFGVTRSFTNDNAGAITKGQPVYVKSNGNVDLADADAASTSTGTIGLVAASSIASTASGAVCLFGIVDGFDTSGLPSGSLVYVATGTAGALTSTQPTGSGAQIKPIGICLESHATTGRVLVAPSWFSAIPVADGAAIFDENGNEILVFDLNASAVNEVAVNNAATGNAPGMAAQGGDTNIDLSLAAKGTGIVKGPLVPMAFAISDETTALTTGTAKLTYVMPRGFEVEEIYACVTTAPTGASLIIDVNDDGATLMTTNKLSIDVSETSTNTAATAPTLTSTTIAAGSVLTFDIDQIGSTVAGAGAKVTLLGRWT